ncbi:MAG TPA: MlaD family protein [Thermoleophilaceae bacterium]|nr:MlaD family protein [Thermoleophilaceae bacterium]
MRRRGAASLAGSPVLIGAVTTLVVVVAVFLAYNANNGLPFVPTYDLKVQLPDAANLVKGDEVREGGTRVGVVSHIGARALPNGSARAVLTLKLQRSIQPLPVDSTVIVRPRSALGLKYVQITRGRASRGFVNGATLPLSAARPTPVEIDDVFNMFNEPTRAAERQNLTTFGDALAGRGIGLNQAIAEFPRLLGTLTPVAANLASPQTGLATFFQALDRGAREVAPVAEAQGELFANLDTTFSSLATVTRAIQDSISGGPPSLDTATRDLPQQLPFLRNSEVLFKRLRPGFAAFGQAAPDLAGTVTAGTPALQRSVALDRRLSGALNSLQEFSQDPRVPLGIHQLDTAASLLRPTVAFVKPAQTVCNYLALFFRNGSAVLSEGDNIGTWQRFIIVAPPQIANSEAGPSTGPANGPQTSVPLSKNSFLHSDPYPNTAAPGQPRECEAGNEGYIQNRAVIGNVPGNQGTLHEVTKVDKSR